LNLLILNLKNDLNDSALGHCPLIVDSLAKKFDNVFVISGYIGKVTKSRNVTYYSIINKKKCNTRTNKGFLCKNERMATKE
jgi:hypothetical protein